MLSISMPVNENASLEWFSRSAILLTEADYLFIRSRSTLPLVNLNNTHHYDGLKVFSSVSHEKMLHQ